MYRVCLIEKEEVLLFKEIEDYENTFTYIETLINQLGENRKIVVHENRNEK
ncbi:hypothetical protein NON08_14560 [Cetobacterium somerae]|uniref:hypothetical protein n=1 Tax=Cetobacterium sp. NK01 TaxID=2993530 RepID=UPI0021168096|nr:hypothetical protein [Cetobacterium sp. NK01]MCQ8213721.1 hypothetical protein [Cetobacterium sp. NK01]